MLGEHRVGMEHAAPTELAFRDGDFWMEFASDFNAVARRMRELESKVAHLENERETVQVG